MQDETIKEIEIWKQKENFVTPLHGGKVATTKIGDFVLIMDGAVWVQHYPAPNSRPFFVKAVYGIKFFRANEELLFERQI